MTRRRDVRDPCRMECRELRFRADLARKIEMRTTLIPVTGIMSTIGELCLLLPPSEIEKSIRPEF